MKDALSEIPKKEDSFLVNLRTGMVTPGKVLVHHPGSSLNPPLLVYMGTSLYRGMGMCVHAKSLQLCPILCDPMDSWHA